METLGKEVIARIDALASKLGVAADHMWPVLVRQQRLVGAVDLIVSGLMVGVVWAGVLCFKKHYTIQSSYYEGGWWALGLSACVVGFVLFLVLSCEGVLRTMNPEYYALADILDTAKGN